MAQAPNNKHNASWQQTMLRIKDPKRTVDFYRDHFNFTLIHTIDFPQWKFSLYFMATLPEGTIAPTPGTPEAEAFLWSFKGVTLEFTHNHGSETDDSFTVNNGNVEPHRGFGHIAVACDDVYVACEELEKKGIAFQKKPDEGRMKGLAFALDPDGYWIEVIRRNPDTGFKGYNLAQTMIRVKDIKRSLAFYCDILGMTLISERHFEAAKFSLYFLAQLPPGTQVPDPKSEEGSLFAKGLFNPVLELTYNHGTELDDNFHYHNGNTDPRGFGHIGFLVDDVYATCADIEAAGFGMQKKPDDGNMKGLAFALDPDNYWVEIIKRGMTVAELMQPK
eukprot:CAMPEP_0114556202 /NCGR_PEP_ID=MMETSP0114-20121206/9167_1 /TAXON_ID=31324 /ORGANISM="Goniomonas sp, Strain m" /LENGTH=332 /DNA_ID=CAMNT_0001741399 /DNA_START=10 /DNA_END=1008 /DNA_ORIENTATION=+